MSPPPPPFNPGHSADISAIIQGSTNPGRDVATNPGRRSGDFESIIANQRILFETGRPATPNTPVRFATTSRESTTGPTTSPNTPVTFVTTSQEPTTGPTAGPSPEIEDEDEDNKLMIIAGVSLCVCMIVVAAIFMMKR